MMNGSGPIGAIRICSIVPRSFSRTTDSAVETTAVIIEMKAIRPGTRKSVLRSCGLYQMRGSRVSGGAPAASLLPRWPGARRMSLGDDRLRVAHDRGGGVGVVAVDDDLHIVG